MQDCYLKQIIFYIVLYCYTSSTTVCKAANSDFLLYCLAFLPFFFFFKAKFNTTIQTVMTNTDLMLGVWSWRGPIYVGLKGDTAIKVSDIISDCHGLTTNNSDCG